MPAAPALKVLIVDDHHYAATSLGRLLSGMGHLVEVAADGSAALLKIAEFRPQVLLVDIAMPGMDGNELARRVRAQGDLHDVVLIALTGWSQESEAHHSIGADFDEHLLKPVDLSELEALLGRFCIQRTAAAVIQGSINAS